MRMAFFLLALLTALQLSAQTRKTKNVIIITFDGLRWQELFGGAEWSLLVNRKYVTQDSARIAQQFWAATPEARREKLMPFFWGYIAKQGQVYGNRPAGNKVDVKNPYWFSYPGYNEIFTGYPDTAVNSNSYPDNPNTNVLEYINRQPGFAGKVAAFGSWDAFPRILNEKRSGFPVNAGYEDVTANQNGRPLTRAQQVLNQSQHAYPRLMGAERLDGSTYYMAKEYLLQNHPRVFYISFGDMDEFAHEGHYDLYLQSVLQADRMLADLWKTLQSDPFYKDNTTFFMTVDHGRGLDTAWTDHGANIPHAGEIWMAAMGPDTRALGEVKTEGQLYQAQFAQTIARFLGLQFKAAHPVAEAVEGL